MISCTVVADTDVDAKAAVHSSNNTESEVFVNFIIMVFVEETSVDRGCMVSAMV